eukprot:Trichotokara_eunicae@DN5751_c0_g1_i1.p1
MLEHGTNPYIKIVDRHILVVGTGMISDLRQIVDTCRAECGQYQQVFGHAMPPRVLAERVALFVHAYTLGWTVRPFGVCVLVGMYDETGKKFELYSIDPSGECHRYRGNALGKARLTLKAEIGKLKLEELDADEAIIETMRMLKASRDEGSASEQHNELEIGWIRFDQEKETFIDGGLVPRSVLAEHQAEVDRRIAALEED